MTVPLQSPRRIQRNVLAESEKRLLAWICPRLPAWVTPDKLTVLALLAAATIGAGYALSNFDPAWLALSVIGYFVHWFGDSLDGTIARYREVERPRFGYFIDHSCDGLASLLILGGLVALVDRLGGDETAEQMAKSLRADFERNAGIVKTFDIKLNQ